VATIVEFETVVGFILDDPIAGVLDNGVYTLSGESFSDITDYMIEMSLGRGKSRDLDRFSSGALSVTLNNETRAFDPNHAAGPFYRQIVPRRKIRVTTDGVRQFTGVIDDWNFAYDPGNSSKTEIVATDDFTLLARQLVTGTATPQATGARVSAVLDQTGVLWPEDERDISTGVSELGADVLEGNALEYLQIVETSEQGALFIGKNGDLVFRDRLDATPTAAGLITFADDGTGIPYTRVNVNYGTELLVNTVTVSSAVGEAQATNDRSRTSYGVAAQSIDTLVNTQEQLENLADFIVSRFGDPEYRFDSVSMNLDTMSVGDKAAVLALELGDVVLIKFTPNGIGDPIEQYGEVIRLDNDIEQIRHDITIGISSLDWTFLVLDDALFGTLDINHLAF
jgi:hypothetical protein